MVGARFLYCYGAWGLHIYVSKLDGLGLVHLTLQILHMIPHLSV